MVRSDPARSRLGPRRGSRRLAGASLAVALLAAVACPGRSGDRSREPAYLCPRLLEKCRQCQDADPGFKEWDCEGGDGTVIERCKGKAAARRPWLEKLARALAQDSCREFEEIL